MIRNLYNSLSLFLFLLYISSFFTWKRGNITMHKNKFKVKNSHLLLFLKKLSSLSEKLTAALFFFFSLHFLLYSLLLIAAFGEAGRIKKSTQRIHPRNKAKKDVVLLCLGSFRFPRLIAHTLLNGSPHDNYMGVGKSRIENGFDNGFKVKSSAWCVSVNFDTDKLERRQ